LFADTAVANGVVYANGINWPNPSSGSYPVAGDLVAIAGDGSKELWRFTTPQSPDMGGVAVANGVVYFTSTYSEQLFALDATSGAVLNALAVGRSESGPVRATGTWDSAGCGTSYTRAPSGHICGSLRRSRGSQPHSRASDPQS
jgi:outer membrane protein assembly factor BamB